jgi:hypothetical protein
MWEEEVQIEQEIILILGKHILQEAGMVEAQLHLQVTVLLEVAQPIFVLAA